MKKTINQIRVELSNLSLAHAQINSFFWGDFLRAYKERELDYPLSCCYYPTAQLYTNQTEIPITIIICDKIYKDWSNLNDVESDTLKICRDLFNVINQSQTWQLLGRVQSCTVTKFVERGGDEVAGHQMQINFRLRDKSGICDLPIFGYDFDQDFTTGCEPVLIFKDGLLIDTVPSGGIYEYFSEVCNPATVENSNQSYTDTVASGGTLVLPDITVTNSDGSTYTQPAVTDVFCTPNEIDVYINRILVAEDATEDVLLTLNDQEGNELIFTQDENELTVNIPECEDSTFNINGIEVGTAPSGGTLDLNLIDQNSDVVPFVQTGSDLVVTLPSAGTNSAKVMKTGLLTSYTTGDDGNTRRGRYTDFFTLDFTNPFGNTRRFNGINGGYHDGTNYRLVDGTLSTRAGAFPNDICIDWSTFSNNEVLLYYHGDNNFRGRNAHIAQYLTSTISGLTSWFVVNRQEIVSLMNDESYIVSTHFLAYPPFEYTGGNRRYIWISSGSASTGVTTDFGVFHGFTSGNAANALNSMWCRYTTLTELGL